MWAYLVGGGGSGGGVFGSTESFRDSDRQRHCHAQLTNSRVPWVSTCSWQTGEERKDGTWEVFVSHGWTGSTAGAAETALEALRGVTVEKHIDQKKKKETVSIAQLSLSNYFLKRIYKLEDYCHKGHMVLLRFFDSSCLDQFQKEWVTYCWNWYHLGVSHSIAVFANGFSNLVI